MINTVGDAGDPIVITIPVTEEDNNINFINNFSFPHRVGDLEHHGDELENEFEADDVDED